MESSRPPSPGKNQLARKIDKAGRGLAGGRARTRLHFLLHCLAQIEHKSPCRSGMGIQARTRKAIWEQNTMPKSLPPGGMPDPGHLLPDVDPRSGVRFE